MFQNNNDELQNFKRRTDLVQLAESYGYLVVRKESCRSSIVMKNEANASKIIVANAEDGHGIFFEVHGDAKGSAIDFVMYREGCTLGTARKVLREWLGQPRPEPVREYIKPPLVKNNRASLAAEWHKMRDYDGDYLKSRGLSTDTIKDFSHHMKMDTRGNVCFRHDDENGLSGWETKNRGFTGFSGGGKKALFMCNTCPSAEEPTRIVITEAAIDAMSYAQLSNKPALYVSLSGTASDAQRELLAKLFDKYPRATVVTATDADAQGEKYAMMIHAMCPNALRVRPKSAEYPGVPYKDWNDLLMNRPKPPVQSSPEQSPASPEHQPVAPHDLSPSASPKASRGKGAMNVTPDP